MIKSYCYNVILMYFIFFDNVFINFNFLIPRPLLSTNLIKEVAVVDTRIGTRKKGLVVYIKYITQYV